MDDNIAIWTIAWTITYVVQSKSNATDEIKQKLLFVHKNVFLRNFPHIYCRSECTFHWASTTAGSRRRTGLWSRNAWPPPRSSSSPPGSTWWITAETFPWITDNTLSSTNQAKTVHFQEPGSCRRLTKCSLRQRRAHQIWSLIANFFTRLRTLCRILKFALTETVGHVEDPWKWLGILLFSEAATVAVRSWGLLVFFKFQERIIHCVLAYQNMSKML